MVRAYKSVVLAIGILAALGLAGCAGTLPTAEFSHKIVASNRVCAKDSVTVNVNAADSLKILPVEKERIAKKS